MPLILVRISMIPIQYRWLGTNLEVGEKSVNRLLGKRQNQAIGVLIFIVTISRGVIIEA